MAQQAHLLQDDGRLCMGKEAIMAMTAKCTLLVVACWPRLRARRHVDLRDGLGWECPLKPPLKV